MMNDLICPNRWFVSFPVYLLPFHQFNVSEFLQLVETVKNISTIYYPQAILPHNDMEVLQIFFDTFSVK